MKDGALIYSKGGFEVDQRPIYGSVARETCLQQELSHPMRWPFSKMSLEVANRGQRGEATGAVEQAPRESAALGFPKRSAIFHHRLPKYEQRHDGRQHKRCKPHLNKYEAGRVFTKKPSCDNATNPQELVCGPGEPIR